MTQISGLKVGEERRIVDITAESVVRERLLEMGLAPGRSVKFLRRLPFHGPFVIQAGSLFLALREDEALHVWVEDTK